MRGKVMTSLALSSFVVFGSASMSAAPKFFYGMSAEDMVARPRA